jgi:hypothetical protein
MRTSEGIIPVAVRGTTTVEVANYEQNAPEKKSSSHCSA